MACQEAVTLVFHWLPVRMCAEAILITRQAEKERFNNNKEKNLSLTQWNANRILKKCARFEWRACTAEYNTPDNEYELFECGSRSKNQSRSLTKAQRTRCTAKILNDKYWPLSKHAGTISLPEENIVNILSTVQKFANQSSIDGNWPKKKNSRRLLQFLLASWLVESRKWGRERAKDVEIFSFQH